MAGSSAPSAIIGAFSMQQGKHMSTGEGGMVIGSNPALNRRMTLFSDKAWGYGDPKPDHYFLALNYRMTELQGAVARAQLQKVNNVVARRQSTADMMTSLISDLPGLTLPIPVAGYDARLLEVPARRGSQGDQGWLGRAR
jgi:dTDP-4-amino-4,6-dideoxygalactose transaminase